ncbi:MAG: hypothetical protein PGN07_03625 [Aeromicrobium erythreum]
MTDRAASRSPAALALAAGLSGLALTAALAFVDSSGADIGAGAAILLLMTIFVVAGSLVRVSPRSSERVTA